MLLFVMWLGSIWMSGAMFGYAVGALTPAPAKPQAVTDEEQAVSEAELVLRSSRGVATSEE